MEKQQEDELRRKAEEQSHDQMDDPELTVDDLTGQADGESTEEEGHNARAVGSRPNKDRK